VGGVQQRVGGVNDEAHTAVSSSVGHASKTQGAKTMNKMLRAAVVATAMAGSAAAWAKVDVNVGVTIREPGVYGRVEVGTSPPPPVYYPQPVVITQPVVVVGQPVVVQPAPMYLYVPPGHAKKWRKHCYKYDACGRPVYFVQEDWVRTSYQQANPDWRPRPVPYRHAPVMHGDHHGGKHHGKHGDKHHGKGKKDD
jgi:hypothetical protein